jgi:WD40 repeat protein
MDTFSKQEYLVSASRDKTIKIWSVETGDPVRKLDIEEDEPSCVAVMNQTILFLGSTNHGMLRTWKIDSGIQYDDLPMNNATMIYTMLVYTDDRLIVGTNRNFQIRKMHIGPVLSSSLVSMHEGHERGVRCMIYYNDQQDLITGGVDGTVRFWNLARGKSYMKLYGHEKAVLAIAVADVDRLISGSADKTIIIWNLINGTCLRRLTDHTDWVNALLMRQNRLISCSDDHTIRVWNVKTRECEKISSNHGNNVLTLLLAKNGSLVSTACDGTIKIWK